MAKEKLFQVGVKVLILNQAGKILVLDSGDWHLKNQERHWDIPGGRIQEGHSILDTLQREVKEETGIPKINDVSIFASVISNFPDMPVGDQMAGLLLLVFKIKVPANSEIKLSHEHSGHEWVSKREAAKRLAYKYPEDFTKKLTKN